MAPSEALDRLVSISARALRLSCSAPHMRIPCAIPAMKSKAYSVVVWRCNYLKFSYCSCNKGIRMPKSLRRMMRDKDSKQSKGFAFIMFMNNDAAQKTIKGIHEEEFKISVLPTLGFVRIQPVRLSLPQKTRFAKGARVAFAISSMTIRILVFGWEFSIWDNRCCLMGATVVLRVDRYQE